MRSCWEIERGRWLPFQSGRTWWWQLLSHITCMFCSWKAQAWSNFIMVRRTLVYWSNFQCNSKFCLPQRARCYVCQRACMIILTPFWNSLLLTSWTVLSAVTVCWIFRILYLSKPSDEQTRPILTQWQSARNWNRRTYALSLSAHSRYHFTKHHHDANNRQCHCSCKPAGSRAHIIKWCPKDSREEKSKNVFVTENSHSTMASL
jgi:hypothetical protein